MLSSLLSLIRQHLLRSRRVLDAVFLVGLVLVFVLQLIEGLRVNGHPGDDDPVRTIAVLVVVCFLLGISRAWELIGGPSFGVRQEVVALVHPGQSAARTEPGQD